MRGEASHLHDAILLPLNVAAHSAMMQTALPADSLNPTFSFSSLVPLVRDSVQEMSSIDSSAEVIRVRSGSLVSPEASLHGSRNSEESFDIDEGFSITFVMTDAPCAAFSIFASTLSDFLTNHAVGIATRTVRISSLPPAARRLSMYVFMLDSPEGVDSFYKRVHLASDGGTPDAAARHDPWPTCQVRRAALGAC